MDDHLVPITVTVPRESIADLYAYVASLHAGDDEDPWEDETLNEDDGGGTNRRRAAAGFGAATVRKSYLGGISDYWRPFLEELAANPDQWLSWEHLCATIGMTNRQAAGMLGAAERRCKGMPPYEKSFGEGTHWFRMPKDVAEVILDLAGKRSE